MYKDFPYLQEDERLSKISPLSVQQVLAPQYVVPAEDIGSVESLKLLMLRDRPIYQWEVDGVPYQAHADDGTEVSKVSKEEAEEIVRAFDQKDYQVAQNESSLEMDQWTVRTRFVPYLPFHKITVADHQGLTFYVSSQTGEVMQRLDNVDKMWAWLGAIPHWIYFRDLRVDTPLWRVVVIYLSGFGILMSVSGLVMGIIRLKYRKKQPLKFSPYKKFWFKWHHYTGFVFGLIVCTWIISGYFSMNPSSWSPSTSLSSEEAAIWKGDRRSLFMTDSLLDLSLLYKKEVPKEIKFDHLDARPIAVAQYGDRSTQSMYLDSLQLFTLGEQEVRQLIRKFNSSEVKDISLLNQYDAYYYSKWNRKNLPVWRVSMQDDQQTLYYIDPNKASVEMKYIKLNRFSRWIYQGLHSLDFPALLQRRPLWDIVVIILMLGGTAVSITGVVLTWKWLKRSFRKATR